MPILSYSEIEIISADVKSARVNFSHLCDDLIDHICCDVESEMHRGTPFREAYRSVKKRIGYGRLREIQEETLYAVDTKYRNMKTFMKISGITGSALFGFAALFKIQHWPMAGVMLTLGAIVLALVFMPSALIVLWKETKSRSSLFMFTATFLFSLFFIFGTLFKVQHWPGAGWLMLFSFGSAALLLFPSLIAFVFTERDKKKDLPLYIVAIIGLVFFILGLFFKIQHWPLATILLVAGTAMLALIALPWYTFLKWKDELHVSSKFIFILLGLVIIILPGALVNLNLQASYDRGFFHHTENQKAVNAYLSKNNSEILLTYRDSSCYEKMGKLNSLSEELCNYITQLQVQLVQISEGKPGNPALSPEQVVKTGNKQEIIYEKLSKPFDYMPVLEMFSREKNIGRDLKVLLDEYSKELKKIADDSGLVSAPPVITANGFAFMAEGESFRGSMMSVMHSLEVLKNAVLATEARLLSELAGINK